MKLWVPDGKLHLVYGRGTVLEPDGSIAWQGEWERNFLADEGEQDVLEVYLRQIAHKDKWLALLTATPTETSTMATMTEVGAGVGYSRQAFVAGGGDWGATALNAGDFQTTAASKTFGPASASAWTITYAAIVTVASGTGGKLIAAIPLSGTTTVNVGQTFAYVATIKAQ